MANRGIEPRRVASVLALRGLLALLVMAGGRAGSLGRFLPAVLAAWIPFPACRERAVPGQPRTTSQDENDQRGRAGLEGSSAGIFGPANSCPSAPCQNMLGVHLDPCPGVSARSGSCGCLHDNSRSCVNCCARSQMLLCTCGLIRWHFPPHKRAKKFCLVSMSEMCRRYNGRREESCGRALNNDTCSASAFLRPPGLQ